MKKLGLFVMLISMGAAGARAWDGTHPTPEEVSAYRHIETLRQLAGDPAVIGDIKTQERELRDAGQTERLRQKWEESTGAALAVRPFLEKPSCKTMRDYQMRTFPLVDCFTLDAEGRVVGELYQTREFLQDQEPHFILCYNHGAGRVYVDRPGPVGAGMNHTVEISLPVLDGSKTIGVLVAMLLLDK